jgi:hypothetical protein
MGGSAFSCFGSRDRSVATEEEEFTWRIPEYRKMKKTNASRRVVEIDTILVQERFEN